MILNGIESLAERADLADRAIVLELPIIPESRRRPESELWRQYEFAWPVILGGLCDAAASALRNQAHVRLGSLPRMADFAVWVVAAESALGHAPGEFMNAYSGNRRGVVESTIDADIVARAIKDMMCDRDEWTGTNTELLAVLNTLVVDERAKKSQTLADEPPRPVGPCYARRGILAPRRDRRD